MKIEQKHFDAMINRTKCKFWDGDRKKIIGSLVGIAVNQEYPFYCEGRGYYENCEPLETKYYYKSRSDIFDLLCQNNYKPDAKGNLWGKNGNVFKVEMWQYCDKPFDPVAPRFLPEWLEEGEV